MRLNNFLSKVKDVTRPINSWKQRSGIGKFRSIEEADKDLIRKQIVLTIDSLKKVLLLDEKNVLYSSKILWRIVKAMGLNVRP